MSQASQNLVSDLKILAADAEELVRVTAAQTGDKINAVRGKIQQSVTELKPQLARAEAALADSARAAAKSSDTFVHERPWTAVGIAAGVGLVVGLLIGRH